MNKLEGLNKFAVEDWSCCGEELEYVLSELSQDDFRLLYDAGFTEAQIREHLDDESSNMIDLAGLATCVCNNFWWSKSTGFVAK